MILYFWPTLTHIAVLARGFLASRVVSGGWFVQGGLLIFFLRRALIYSLTRIAGLARGFLASRLVSGGWFVQGGLLIFSLRRALIYSLTHIAYNAKGQRLLIAYGNGTMRRYCYDSLTFRVLRYRTESFDWNPATPYTFEYAAGVRQDCFHTYDLSGNIISINNKVADCGTGATPDELIRDFQYDALYRLLSATGREGNANPPESAFYDEIPLTGSPNATNTQGYTQEFTHDKLGNIITLVHTVGLTHYVRNYKYDPDFLNNKLLSVKNSDETTTYSYFEYDSRGNQTNAVENHRYHWDAADQLIGFINQAGTSQPSVYAQYLYSGGKRVKKLVRTDDGGVDVTVYIDGAFEHRYHTNSDEQTVCYIMDDSKIIASVRTGDNFGDAAGEDISGTFAVIYNLDDHLGSSALRLTNTGTEIDKEEYYPFGDSSLRTFSFKRLRYCGKEKDAESGLYYYGARYYSAWMCRFISVDPLAGKYAHQSSFVYADNNPVGKVDFNGEGTDPTPTPAPESVLVNPNSEKEIEINNISTLYVVFLNNDTNHQYNLTQDEQDNIVIDLNDILKKNTLGDYYRAVQIKQEDLKPEKLKYDDSILIYGDEETLKNKLPLTELNKLITSETFGEFAKAYASWSIKGQSGDIYRTFESVNKDIYGIYVGFGIVWTDRIVAFDKTRPFDKISILSVEGIHEAIGHPNLGGGHPHDERYSYPQEDGRTSLYSIMYLGCCGVPNNTKETTPEIFQFFPSQIEVIKAKLKR